MILLRFIQGLDIKTNQEEIADIHYKLTCNLHSISSAYPFIKFTDSIVTQVHELGGLALRGCPIFKPDVEFCSGLKERKTASALLRLNDQSTNKSSSSKFTTSLARAMTEQQGMFKK